ncbi:patatin-like phospholipase family protein [Kitasatospora purpeofusca]|uniref:patatin-like phospholipase family protein n=1 Tax=Kitasatospora purpeofusca TaxID=67352 RepID=UPI002A5ADECD|nr:patatin-like phospholipase family protein [Kitasatospora purpeofusca]MDY0816115.1 patatin-like phospholipase family protein [Kitasatospora purpeofusca]
MTTWVSGTRPTPPRADGAPRRGLVLGGGGMLGAAWTVGALCAVEEATGRRAGDAEVVLGTSAGAILGALLAAGVGAEQLRDHQRGLPITSGPLAGVDFDYDTAVGGALPPWPRVGIGSPRLLRDAVRHPRKYPLLTLVSAMAPHGRGSLEQVGALFGGLFGSTGAVGATGVTGQAGVTGAAPTGPAPLGVTGRASPLRVVAVDYRSGHRVVFGDPDAPLAGVGEAVMASCAIPGWFAPVRVGGADYVDGGCWSATNADLLLDRGLDEVYVLAPMALRSDPPGRPQPGHSESVGGVSGFARARRGRDLPRGVLAQLVGRYRRAVTRQLLREAGLLRAGGVRVHLLAPAPADLAVMGPNMMDPARRGPVLESALDTCRRVLEAAG